MPKTSVSGSSPYASPADYMARVDVNLTGDLVRDDGSRATPTELLTDPNLAAALGDASGTVEISTSVGAFYDVVDLQALNGNGLDILKRIVCGLTIQFLRERRGQAGESDHPMFLFATRMLEALEKGAAVFPFAEVKAASIPISQRLTRRDYHDQGLLTENTRYWGELNNRRGQR